MVRAIAGAAALAFSAATFAATVDVRFAAGDFSGHYSFEVPDIDPRGLYPIRNLAADFHFASGIWAGDYYSIGPRDLPPGTGNASNTAYFGPNGDYDASFGVQYSIHSTQDRDFFTTWGSSFLQQPAGLAFSDTGAFIFFCQSTLRGCSSPLVYAAPIRGFATYVRTINTPEPEAALLLLLGIGILGAWRGHGIARERNATLDEVF